jgi:hypothetical protein
VKCAGRIEKIASEAACNKWILQILNKKDPFRPASLLFIISPRTEYSYAIRTLTFELRCPHVVSEHLTFPTCLCGSRTNVPRPQTQNRHEEKQPNIAFAKNLTLNLWFWADLLYGERVLLEESHALSRYGTERLQIYSHSFASLSGLFV